MSIKIDEQTLNYTKEIFKKLESEVKLYLFTTKMHCLYCNEVEKLVNIVSSLSNLIKVIKCECEVDSPEARKFGIDKHPAIVFHGKEEYNIRYFGIPGGYEYGVLIEDIVDVSLGKTDLPKEIIDSLSRIDKEIHIQVFVTPTCPYCPIAARMAHKFAIINKNIKADVIEAIEFQDLARKYNVLAVPKIIINDIIEFEGAVPEKFFLNKILEALEKSE
jgi:glutaredoxin-like protein